MLVIGGGGAGYAVASTAARLGKRVSMAEHGKLGRTCRDFFQRCPILHSNPSGGALPSGVSAEPCRRMLSLCVGRIVGGIIIEALERGRPPGTTSTTRS